MSLYYQFNGQTWCYLRLVLYAFRACSPTYGVSSFIFFFNRVIPKGSKTPNSHIIFIYSSLLNHIMCGSKGFFFKCMVFSSHPHHLITFITKYWASFLIKEQITIEWVIWLIRCSNGSNAHIQCHSCHVILLLCPYNQSLTSFVIYGWSSMTTSAQHLDYKLF